MAEQIYLVNPTTGKRYRIGGCKLSTTPVDEPKFAASRMFADKDLPPLVDLRSMMTAVEDQKETNACVANALAGAYEFLIKVDTKKNIDVSRLFIYYNARVKDGMSEENMEDDGCTILGAIKTLKRDGCCKEKLYPYNIKKINQKPPAYCYEEAKKYRIVDGMAVAVDLNEMKSCLAQKYPFAFGIRLFVSFGEAETNGGIVTMPESNEQGSKKHNLHAMLAVGYSDRAQCFIVRNSWGSDWAISNDSRRRMQPIRPNRSESHTYQPYEYHPYGYETNRSEPYTYQPYEYQPYEYQPYGYEINRYKNDSINILPSYYDGYYDATYFWNIDNSNYYHNINWIITSMSSYTKFAGSSKNTSGIHIERISKNTTPTNSYILWIDKKTEDNSLVMKQLINEQPVHIEFCETYSMAENYLQKTMEKIKSSSSPFQIICRGYYKSEDKNPLNLLFFLDRSHLKWVPVIVFTQDKEGLMYHLQNQAPSMSIQDWKDRLYIVNNSTDLIAKVKSNIKNKRGNNPPIK
ncbi:unnamed protein product [Rotaria sp. Silwood1]|nr:unnamed protein product [Rotaria sp. Silwood1]